VEELRVELSAQEEAHNNAAAEAERVAGEQQARIAELRSIGQQIAVDAQKRIGEEDQLASQVETARTAEAAQLKRLEEVRAQLAAADLNHKEQQAKIQGLLEIEKSTKQEIESLRLQEQDLLKRIVEFRSEERRVGKECG